MSSQYISQKYSWKLDADFFQIIRKDLFTAILCKAPYEFYSKDSGDYSTMLNNEISACQEYIEYLMQTCEAVIGLVTYAIYIFFLSPTISVIIYFTAAITLFLPRITGKKLSDKKNYLLERTIDYNSKVIDLLKGYPLINYYTFKHIFDRYKTSLNVMETARYDYGKFQSFTNVLNGSVMYIINTSALAVIAVLLLNGSITAGVATATVKYINDFMFPLRTVIDSVSNIKSVSGVKNKIISEINSAVPFPNNTVNLKTAIQFDNVCYKLDNFCLNNFSYTFEKGKKYAIIGPSGSGKTTILNLLMGVVTPFSGQITIEGQKISHYLCKNSLMYINQHSHIFIEPFQDNVTVFNCFSASNKVKTFIPDEKIEYLSECKDCTQLSGGEQQLVNFIRALNSKCDILVLDEPFSALDTSLETDICRNLLKDPDLTVIMVTHNENKDFLQLFDNIISLNNTSEELQNEL